MFKIFLLLMAALFLVIIYAWKIEPRWVDFRKETLCPSKLPKKLDGMKIAFLTDLHVSSNEDLELLKDQIKKIDVENPDLFLVGGDIAQSIAWLKKTAAVLAAIKTSCGSYVVRGNHDVDAGNSFFSVLSSEGLLPCGNDQFRLQYNGQPFILATIDDFRLADSRPARALRGVTPQDFTILMAHEPKSIKLLEKEKLSVLVDFALIGHTHGGQVTVFGLYSPLAQRSMPQWKPQWQPVASVPTLYSNGLGQKYRLRFCARPQLHLITLESPGD